MEDLNLLDYLVPHSETTEELTFEGMIGKVNSLNRSLLLSGFPEMGLELKPLERIQEDRDGNKILSSLFSVLSNVLEEYSKLRSNKSEQGEAFMRLKNEKEQLVQTKEKLEVRVNIMKQDLGFAETREKGLVQQHKKDKQGWDRERDELMKKMTVIQSREKQYLHELKKKDLQYEKLKEKVAEVQKGTKPSTPAVLNAPKTGTVLKKPTPSATVSTKPKPILTRPPITEDKFKLAFENEQAKVQKMLEENSSLRASFKELQREFESLMIGANMTEQTLAEETFDLPLNLLQAVMQETQYQIEEMKMFAKENPSAIITHRRNEFDLENLEKTVNQMKNQFSENIQN